MRREPVLAPVSRGWFTGGWFGCRPGIFNRRKFADQRPWPPACGGCRMNPSKSFQNISARKQRAMNYRPVINRLVLAASQGTQTGTGGAHCSVSAHAQVGPLNWVITPGSTTARSQRRRYASLDASRNASHWHSKHPPSLCSGLSFWARLLNPARRLRASAFGSGYNTVRKGEHSAI